ncbi:hypoxanthine-guanine phosphoribosyl transferase [Streptococcus pyogenes]|nr:hypoxanthine-guanine phosphoribosyl transferase [Streptococcus pyogenes]
MFKYRKANTIKIATLFDKPEGRVVKIEADYVCYNIPNEFIVGFGLDYAENLSQSSLRRCIKRRSLFKIEKGQCLLYEK